jgi:hypothetical protein
VFTVIHVGQNWALSWDKTNIVLVFIISNVRIHHHHN